MKLYSILLISVVLLISRIVSSLKYQNIGDCHYYDDIVGKCNLTFICVDSPQNTSYFNPDVKSVCLNQHLYQRYKDGFSKYWIGTINFQNCDRLQMPPNIFAVYDRVHTFNMSDIGIESLKSVKLAGAKRLTKLIASHNNIIEIPSNLFNQSITNVDLSFNKIRQIDSNALPSGNHLEILDLSFNNISDLNVNTFQMFGELKQLSLSNNGIVEIPSFLFHTTGKLIDINLSFNKIRKVDDFAFSGDFDLKKLNLSHNQLIVLHRKIVENLSNLSHLDVSSNQITVLMADAFECLENIIYLDLSNNPIRKVDNQSFWSLVKLQQLILSNTSLLQIDVGAFSTLQNLRILDISNNRLKMLDVNILPMLPNQLKSFSIANNELRELNGFSNARISDTKIIGIDSNQFNCSYFERLFLAVTWKHLESITKRINCSTTIEIDESKNQDSQYMDTLVRNDSKTSKPIIILTLFNVICLTIYVITLSWFGIRKQPFNKYRIMDVFYRRKGAEQLTNDIEIGD